MFLINTEYEIKEEKVKELKPLEEKYKIIQRHL
jgi:hypothetical protein